MIEFEFMISIAIDIKLIYMKILAPAMLCTRICTWP